MKNFKLFLLALLVTALIAGCSDDDDDKKTVCKILSEYFDSGSDTRYGEYVYDDISGLLLKINYSQTITSDIGYYDTLFYNGSDQLIKIESWWPGEDEADWITTYTYTSGKITKIVKTGTRWDDDTQQEVPYTSTADITYSGSDVATITVTGDGDNMGFKNFTYSNNNINTLDVDFFGNDSLWAGIRAVNYDTKKNIEKNLVPAWSYILFGSSTNNYGLLLMTDSVRMGNQLIDIGDTLFRRSYTYNINDQVETLTSYPSAMQNNTAVATYTWECKEE
jgi:hypothetical protein